ncbi:MAG: hypothetical protein HY608_06415, partial [Planctomycetes bacterium]|nr:hypothetical protein [Planctomycetota bacterium]
MAWRSILSFGSLLGLALAAALWFVAPEDQILALSQEAWIAVAAGSLLVCAGMFPAVAGGCSLPSARLDRIGLAGLAGWGILALVSALQAGRFSSGSASGATAVSCAVLGVWVALGGAQGRHLVAWIGVAPVSGMAVALWRWAGAFLPRVLEEGGIWREAYASASFDLNSFPLPSKNLAGLAGAMALAFCAGVWDRRAPRSARRGILLLGAAGGLAVAASGGEAAAVGLGAGLLGAFARRLGARRSLALGAVAALALGSWGFASGLMDRHAFRVRTLARAGRVTLGAPWLGHGPGSFFGAFDSPDPSGGAPGEVYALEGSSTRVTHAHSLPLQIAVEAGWPCALALGVAVAVALLSVRRDSGPEARVRDGVRGALAAWAVASLFGAEGSLPIALLWGSCGTGFLCSGGRAGGATAVPGSLRAPLPASARVLLVLAGSALAWEGGIRPASALRALAPRASVLRGGDSLAPARGAVALPDPVAEQAV